MLCEPVKFLCAVSDAIFVFTVKAIIFHPVSVFSGTSRGICRSGIGHLPLDTMVNGLLAESFSFFSIEKSKDARTAIFFKNK